MPNQLIEFCACYEALRQEPLPQYGESLCINITGVRYRVGRIISESVDHSLRRAYL
jgi:hypothetical protein